MAKMVWITWLAWVMSLTTPEIREEGCRRSTSPMGRWRILRQSSFLARYVTFWAPYSSQILIPMEMAEVSTVIRA